MTAPSGFLFAGYRRSWLRGDLLAGTTAAAVVIPQAMGYATIAGLPAEIGLYTCIFPMLAYAFLGGARRLSFSTTSTIVAISATALAGLAIGDPVELVSASATLTLLVGLTLGAFWLLRLGWIVESISAATITGLKLGVGLTVIVGQVLKIEGVSDSASHFLGQVWEAIIGLGDLNLATALLAGGTIVALIVSKKVAPRFPAALFAVGVGIALVAWFGFADRGVALIAEVPSGLPFPAVPDLSVAGQLLPGALAIAVMSYVETITAGRMSRTIDDPPINNDREAGASALAAVAGAFFQTVPPAGGFSQTQVNTEAGAHTQLSEVVTAAAAICVALFLAPVLSDLPEASLAAVVIVAVTGLIDLSAFRRMWTIDKAEFAIAAITALAAVVFDLLAGVAVGVVLTFYLVLHSLNHPVVVELRKDPSTGEYLPARPGDPSTPGLMILRVEGGVYTMNVRRVQGQMFTMDQSLGKGDVLVLDIVGMSDTSITVLDVLREADQQLEERGISLWLAALPSKFAQKFERAQMEQTWRSRGKLYDSVGDAVAAFDRMRGG